MFPLKKQRGFADRDIARNLYDPWSHHMGYHSWYEMKGLWGWFVWTGHRWTPLRFVPH